MAAISVPEPGIRERNRRLWAQIAEAIVIAHDVGFYDNSRAGAAFRRVESYRRGVMLALPIGHPGPGKMRALVCP